MQKHIKITIRLFSFALLLLMANCQSPEPVKKDAVEKKVVKQAANGKVLTIGSVAFSFKNEEMVTQPLGDFLIKWLVDYGYTSSQVIIVNTKEELAQLANEDKIDLFFASLYPTIYVDYKSKMEPKIRIWQGGLDTYKAVFFTRVESGINNISDFAGRIVTMERNFSTSGYFLPSIILEEYGYDLTYLDSPAVKTNNKTGVGYCFSNDDENTVFWVLNGKSEIGVADNLGLEQYAGPRIDELKIIHESQPIPRNIVSMRSNLPKKIESALFKAFSEIRETQEGRKICKTFYDCTKFDSLKFPIYEEMKNKFAPYINN